MNYRLKVDIVFEAESLDKALDMLQEHFLAVAEPDSGYSELDFVGEIDLRGEDNSEFYNPRKGGELHGQAQETPQTEAGPGVLK